MLIEMIVTGGQTGADRAAWDAALDIGIAIGGYVPHRRIAEDGVIPERYARLTETETSDPAERTELNVLNSDATLLFSRGQLSGGSLLTYQHAHKHGKPLAHIDLAADKIADTADACQIWLSTIECRVLNVAGPRLSEDPRIYADVTDFLFALLGDDEV